MSASEISTTADHAPSADAEVVLADVLRRGVMPMAYQPVIELATGQTIGFEALARPQQLPGAHPRVGILDVQDAAAIAGHLIELDRICRQSAIADEHIGDLPDSLTWFVNAEPRAMTAAPPSSQQVAGSENRRIIVEVTERAIADDPAALFGAAHTARTQGHGIAVDDVGVEPASLALLPILRPDVVKLDTCLLGYLTDPALSDTISAVLGFAERSGAPLLAEGIETAEHLHIARLLGATYAQGYFLGRPGPLPQTVPVPATPLSAPHHPSQVSLTPFQILAGARPVLQATKELLLPLTRHLERQAEHRGEPLALFTSFHDPVTFTAAVQRKYRTLATKFAFVATFSERLPPTLPAGVHPGRLSPADPLRQEWDLVVLGPHYAAALTARDLGDTGPDHQRRFDYVFTHDRYLVEHTAQAMARRLSASGDETR